MRTDSDRTLSDIHRPILYRHTDTLLITILHSSAGSEVKIQYSQVGS